MLRSLDATMDTPRAERLRSLFALPVEVVIVGEEWGDIEAFPVEEARIRNAVDRRKRQFRAGRACARAALVRLGASAAPLPIMQDRRPEWPAGFVGSITHCNGCIAAVAGREGEVGALGLDIEVRGVVDFNLAGRVMHLSERNQLSVWKSLADLDVATIVFSAKEAFYKAYYPATCVFLDFQDVRLAFTGDPTVNGGIFRLEQLAPGKPEGDAFALDGFWWVDDRFVHCGMGRSADRSRQAQGAPTGY